MRTEFVYSIIALGAIPVVANAADAKQIDAIVSVDGAKQTINVGKLVPGSYTFSAKLTSKVYGVTVKIAGKTQPVPSANNPVDPNVTINFDLDKETDVELELVSSDPGESGAGFTVAEAVVILNFDLAAAKAEWADAINALKTTQVAAYDYDDDEEKADKDAADKLIAKLNKIADTYEEYVAQKLYQKASVPQGEIDALEAQIKGHQNTQAYNNVNAAITAIKAKYNDAVADLKAALVNEAAYLLDAALKDLDDNINKKITDATQASYASYTGKTAVADEATNKALIPTEKALNDIVTNWTGQGTANQNAYDGLHKIVTDMQGDLDAIVPAEAIASQFAEEIAAAQAAIGTVNTKVENAKNSAAQLTLGKDAAFNNDVTTAQGKITTLAGKVNTANAEYKAWQDALTAIGTLQTNLETAKTTVNALKSKDGQYEAKDYYDQYVADIQKEINDRTAAANKAYKEDHDAVHYDVNAKPVQNAIDVYGGTKEPAVDGQPKKAVDKYDALQTAMASYQKDLDAARAKVEKEYHAVYTDPKYDYELQFDLIQKRIKDIQKAIEAAQKKVGEEHWTAMIAINEDATITTKIAELLSSVQADQNQYDADFLANGMDTLKKKIDAFKAKDASVLGADENTFQDVEKDINAAYTAVKDAKGAINAQSETVDYTAKVNKDVSGWNTEFINPGYWTNYQNQTINGLAMVEHWCDQSNKDKSTGEVLYQVLNNVENGKYTLEIYANAVDQSAGCPNKGKEDIAFVFANGKQVPVKVTDNATNEVYTISDVEVADGTLRWGLNKAKGGTNWHSIQIKSLKANTASLIQGWGAKIAELNNQQTALEAAADPVAAKVAANEKAQSDLNTAIGDNTATPKTGLWKEIDDFKKLYKIGEGDSPLGNRGKADGAVTKAVNDLSEALTTLQGDNNAVNTSAVQNENITANVDLTWGGIGAAGAWASPHVGVDTDPVTLDVPMREKYNASSCTETGVIVSQTLNVENGIYDVTLYANANHANDVDNNHGITGDATDVAFVFANGSEKAITAKNQNTNATNGEYTLSNVLVSDGKLTIGILKKKQGTNWHTIQIKSLTYHQNSQDALYNNPDEKNPGLNNRFTALNTEMNALKDAAPGIKTAVENNAKSYKAANTAMAGVKTHIANKLKNDDSVNKIIKADGSFSGSAKMTVYTENDFILYRTGLEKDYPTVRTEMLNDTVAMRNAINAAFAAETLPYPWNDEITVTTPDDPATPDTDESSSTTYKVADIKAAVDVIRATAEKEQANWFGYRQIRSTGKADTGTIAGVNDNQMTKAFTDARVDLATKAGAGAADYYIGLVGDGADVKGSYENELEAIRLAMFNSLKARTAVADQSGFIDELKALKAKIDAVQGDADANLKKYNEQVKEYTETQTLWNSTYTQIAATDKSSEVQAWLDKLDKIQETLTTATNVVEESYPVGKSVANAQDFSVIKTAINTVKNDQQDAYNAYVALDNANAHVSFVGGEIKDIDGNVVKIVEGTIQTADKAYKDAVDTRASYNSTDKGLQAAIDAAAANLDQAIFDCPTDILNLKAQEKTAYEAVVEPGEVFDVDPYNTAALAIAQDITDELEAFETAIGTAIADFWKDTKKDASDKLADAKADIDGYYSKDVKDNAFNDVVALITLGDNGVKAQDIKKVEEAVVGLSNINEMLAADKDAAAAKDITAAITAANTAYSNTKNYIESKTIVDDYNHVIDTQLGNLNAAKEVADVTLVEYPEETWTWANHDDIVPNLTNVIDVADAAKKAVDDAIDSDGKNTEAYNEMVKVIEPVADKLAEAEAAAAPYKYPTSFANNEATLDGIQKDAAAYKAAGSAVANKASILTRVETLSGNIEFTLIYAFNVEQSGLADDIVELKNQFNTYVAKNGLDDKATAFKTEIEALQKALEDAAIVDIDKPADGIKYNDILDATVKLVALQNDIADEESKLLKANGSEANDVVYNDFKTQLQGLSDQANITGLNEWVGIQEVNDKTINSWLEEINGQIADVNAAIEADKDNIAFYKNQYQASINAIKAKLEPVTKAIAEKQAQWDTNAQTYATLSAQLEKLQGAVTAAKDKVAEYEYVGPDKGPDYTYLIEEYDEDGELVGGVQYDINDMVEWVNEANKNVELNEYWNLDDFIAEESVIVKEYLDESAYNELTSQRKNLLTLLNAAITKKYKANTYSKALWADLVAERTGINTEITMLYSAINYSYSTNEWDSEKEEFVPKDRTSDADYASQKETVDKIKAQINDLSEAVDNLKLLGDANVDGKVNVLDYQKVLNMILDPSLQPDPESEDQTQADLFANIDINQSTVIEVGDLTAIVNYILNGNWQGYAAARSFNRGDNENLSLDYSSVNSDVQRIAVNLENANNYTAFQMDVVLPDGMKIVGTSLSSRAGQSHKLYSRTQQDGSVRILASSISGETFSGNEGAVLYIDVEGAKASSVEILNILFSDVNANTRAFKLGNNVTGIDAIGSTFDALKQKVYDLGGRVMNGVKKGINIIRNADGSTRKVAE